MVAKKSKKGVKLPKRIAGVKVPKALRRSGGQAIAWLSSPSAREIMASVLVAAAAGLASNKKIRRAAKSGAEDAASGASRIGEAIADAATAIMRRAAGGGKTDATPPAGGSPAATRSRSGPTRPGEPGIAH